MHTNITLDQYHKHTVSVPQHTLGLSDHQQATLPPHLPPSHSHAPNLVTKRLKHHTPYQDPGTQSTSLNHKLRRNC